MPLKARRLKTPDWWYKRKAKGAPLTRYALAPLAWLWEAVTVTRFLTAKPYRSPVCVISVGNATLGGSGKTPIERELLRRLKKLGLKASGLSRGYGGSLSGPVRVDPATHSAAEVGDEALMLARDYDMVISRDRAEGLRLIEGDGFDIALADDAHQNTKIAKDVHLLVVDGDTTNDAWPFGDGSVFPMGPMREPLPIALKRADIVVLWLPDETSVVDQRLMKLFGDLPVYVARLIPLPRSEPGQVVGFAAIAKPWKFHATLESLGYDIVDFHGFADHEPLSDTALTTLELGAQARGARLITTEKDWVKLSPEWRERIDYLPITARFDDQAGFMRALIGLTPLQINNL
ncbi:tetraacyldisaccharide 4'-kinase [Asticcacaulis sp. AND118]|uniref:tetraacyldisaccharide 4'-kinase n=1 Tax=Asticcacaulis sp. AND118 TaxID=2840468 RepID=UPI001CFFFC7C|nr:tetraacyldisaccharide 4'-kinase [Asticcacaulis sp. AND118]UDF04515.1 tetraacyldisaccharide 4'-kinase [Asticcacaulis sp. AND118]